MKILFIRFSSIGDIVLTTPIVRAVRKAYPNAQLAYVTKKIFAPILQSNPNLNTVFSFHSGLEEVIPALQVYKPDVVIDLHHNIRSSRLKKAIGAPSHTFPKLNAKKWLLVNTGINLMPKVHIVDRYFEAVKSLNVKSDGGGLDYFIPAETKPVNQLIPASHSAGYVCLVLGAAHGTKTIPQEKLKFICSTIQYPVVLLGGSAEEEQGKQLESVSTHIHSAAGKLSLHESAQVIKHSKAVVTPDTGMMHIAAAFTRPVISVWGNTVPQFGMYPYMPGNETQSVIFENTNLSCRPCSKIGYRQCPKRHFKCMNDIDFENLLMVLKQRL